MPYYRVMPGGLFPADEPSREAFKRLKHGDLVQCEVKRPRNLAWHRMWFALCTKIADNLDNVSCDVVSDVVKIRIGHVETMQTKSGMVQVPKSISFAAMSADEWEDFWDRAIMFILSEVLPGIGREALENEIRDMVR